MNDMLDTDDLISMIRDAMGQWMTGGSRERIDSLRADDLGAQATAYLERGDLVKATQLVEQAAGIESQWRDDIAWLAPLEALEQASQCAACGVIGEWLIDHLCSWCDSQERAWEETMRSLDYECR